MAEYGLREDLPGEPRASGIVDRLFPAPDEAMTDGALLLGVATGRRGSRPPKHALEEGGVKS